MKCRRSVYTDLLAGGLRGLRLIAASRPEKKDNMLGISHDVLQTLPLEALAKNASDSPSDLRVEPGDIFLCLGTQSAYRSLFRSLN